MDDRWNQTIVRGWKQRIGHKCVISGYIRYELDPTTEDERAYLALDGAKSVAIANSGGAEKSVLIETD